MTRPHKRKLLIPNISDTNLDNTFVRASQIDAATEYLCYCGVNMSNQVVCLSNSVLAKNVLARIKMPRLPAHLRTAENIKPKSQLTRFVEMVSWRK